MIDTELEDLLRATLAERAGTVTSGPSWASARPAAPAPRRRRWVAPLAAALVTGGLAAAVLAIRPDGGPTPPARSTTPVPSVTSHAVTTPPPATRAWHATRAKQCPLPAAWRTAWAAPQFPADGVSLTPLSVTDDGTVVAFLDQGPAKGAPRQVVLIAKGASQVQSVYTVARPDQDGVWHAWKYQHWLVVATMLMPRHDKGTIPGDSPLPAVQQLIVIDLDTGRQKVLANLSPESGPVVDGVAVYRGIVYWAQGPSYNADERTVHSYDLASGRQADVVHGRLGTYPPITPLGVLDPQPVDQPDPQAPAHATLFADAPRPLVRELTATGLITDPDVLHTMTTDGTSYAWRIDDQTFGWWSPGSPARYVTIAAPNDTFADLVVSGDLLFVPGEQAVAIDMATGAAAGFPSSGGGKFAGWVASAAGGGTIAAADYAPTSGQWVDGYWVDPQPRLVRIDGDALPQLRC